MVSESPKSLRVSRLARGVVKTFQLPAIEILTTLHALAVIIVVELLIRSVPLPRLSRALGCRVNLDPVVPGAQRLALKELPTRSSRQVRCTRRVARVWPFSQGPCLRSALVAGHLLREHDPAIRLGMTTTGEELHAHAWLEIAGRPLESVSAFDVFHQYAKEDHLGSLDRGSEPTGKPGPGPLE
jgi:hypothetical protein